MARRIRIRLVRDDLGALDLLSMGGFHVASDFSPVRRPGPRWRRWRRRSKPQGRRKLTALLPAIARKLRQRGKDAAGHRPH